MLSYNELIHLESKRHYFVEDRESTSLFQWISSKGTNFTCYIEYLDKQGDEDKINNTIDIIRTLIYTFNKPVQFTFFYWTLLLFILHKFNFNKPIMKILLAHFILRTLGDIVDEFGNLMNHYFANVIEQDANGNLIYKCQYDSPSPEMNPLRWVLTRQIGCALWCFGEIVADWYPLLRTKAVASDKNSLYIVYIACGVFNTSKILLVLYHFTLSPKELYNKKNGTYNKDRVDLFYFTYWLIQLSIIYSSVLYDGAVYLVLRKNLSEMGNTCYGFLKKFKLISEYRIFVSAIICVVFLPIISITIIVKFYFYFKYKYHNLEFSFDEIRQSINNFQYFMIFIDQILLLRSKGGRKNNNNSHYNSFGSKSSIITIKAPKTQNKSNSSNTLIDYNYRMNDSNNNTNTHYDYSSSDTFINSVFSSSRNQYMGNQYLGNQYLGNQYLGNQYLGNQYLGNQYLRNQYLGNQYLGNQYLGNQYLGNQYLGNQYLGNQYLGTQFLESQYEGNQNIGFNNENEITRNHWNYYNYK